MSNRLLFYLTGLVLLAILILLGLNMTAILTGQPEKQTYLRYNDVRGMAVSHQHLLYTLNFKQQNTVIDILNRSVPIHEIQSDKRQPVNIDKIVIYQFNGKPDLILQPITYVNHNLIFSLPEWEKENYLMELSEGELQQLLSQTYDS